MKKRYNLGLEFLDCPHNILERFAVDHSSGAPGLKALAVAELHSFGYARLYKIVVEDLQELA
jgi:hypothetical protein